ncbi:MAG: hypothetical protein ACR2M0_01905 [Chloroflexia bacterium]
MIEQHPPHLSLTPRLQARLATLLARLRLSGMPAEVIEPPATALNEVMEKTLTAERAPHGDEWVTALRVAQNCRPLLAEAHRKAEELDTSEHRRPDPIIVSEMLSTWLITQAELYCKLQITHLGLALSDPDDTDDDDDTETFDLNGHIGEELVRQIELLEKEVQKQWTGDRYLLYRMLYTNYSRLRSYTRSRGWVEETDALNYMMRLARMRGLQYHLFDRPSDHRRRPPGGGRGAQRPVPWVRAGVLGRLLLDRFYWLTAGFGYRPLRALAVNSIVVAGFAYLYWQFNLLCVFYTGGGTDTASHCQAVSYPQSLYFSSLAFFLAAMGEVLPRPLWGQALLVFESIWGFLNISVVIAVILSRQNSAD